MCKVFTLTVLLVALVLLSTTVAAANGINYYVGGLRSGETEYASYEPQYDSSCWGGEEVTIRAKNNGSTQVLMRYMVITQRATDKQLFVSYTEDLSINPSSILWYEIGAGWVDEGGKAHPMDILSVTEIVVSPSNFSPADVTLSLRNNDCYASVDEDILEDDNYAEEATHLLTYNPNGGSCASYREKVGVKVTNNHSSRRYDVVFHFYSHDPTETSWGMDYRDTYGLISLNPGESRELKFASGWTHLDLKAVRVTTPWLKYSSEPDPSYLSSTITGDECY